MYEVIDYFNKDGENVIAIEITEGEFTGTVFSYGEVSFPDPDQPILSFNYTLHESEQDTNSDRFKTLIGDMLTEMIEESLKDKDIVFKGGI